VFTCTSGVGADPNKPPALKAKLKRLEMKRVKAVKTGTVSGSGVDVCSQSSRQVCIHELCFLLLPFEIHQMQFHVCKVVFKLMEEASNS